MKDKEIRADATLKQLAKNNAEAEEELWRFRNPTDGGVALTYEAILVEIPLRYGFTVSSVSTLSDYYSWARLQRRLKARADAADQLMEELAKDPDISEEQIKKAGQKLFMTEGLVNQDAKIFAEMVRIGQDDVRLRQNDQKIELSKEKVSLDSRRIALLEKKAAFADEVKKAAENREGGVTAADMEEIERRLKLM